MYRKAAKQTNVLLLLSKYIGIKTKLLIYKSFIRSNFSYFHWSGTFALRLAPTSWRSLRCRALRLVYNDYTNSYEDLLNKANMSTLHLRRIRNIHVAKEVF